MATARPTLVATHRDITGKAVSRLRHAGKLPAVVYGHGEGPDNVTPTSSSSCAATPAGTP